MHSFEFKSLLRWCLPLATVLLFSACGGGDDNNPNAIVAASNSSLPANAFTATLTGAQQTPPTLSTATASGVVLVDPTTRVMKATLVAAGIAGTAAHIHEGAPGVAGPIIFPMAESPAGSGIWTTQATLTEAQFNVFKAGNYFFNVHSAAFPEGEIRGQIVQQLQTSTTLQTNGASLTGGASTGTAANRYASFINIMTGIQVVPATATQGTALAITIVDTVGKTLTGAVTSLGVAGNSAAIREASAGLIGPVVFPLTETSPASGVWAVRTPLTDLQINALNVNNYYYQITSAIFPNGELRGQIVPTSATNGSTGTNTGTGTGTGTTGTGTTGTGTTGTGMTGTGTTGTTGTGTTGTANPALYSTGTTIAGATVKAAGAM